MNSFRRRDTFLWRSVEIDSRVKKINALTAWDLRGVFSYYEIGAQRSFVLEKIKKLRTVLQNIQDLFSFPNEKNQLSIWLSGDAINPWKFFQNARDLFGVIKMSLVDLYSYWFDSLAQSIKVDISKVPYAQAAHPETLKYFESTWSHNLLGIIEEFLQMDFESIFHSQNNSDRLIETSFSWSNSVTDWYLRFESLGDQLTELFHHIESLFPMRNEVDTLLSRTPRSRMNLS